MKPVRALPLLLAVLIAAIAIGASLLMGAAALPVDRVLATLFGAGTSGERSIVIDLRLPRALLAGLAGG
ncbi:MAG TPA: iron chelate uptake ABC transporter family permease subunit, partial [Longimicrobiales bacterium]